MRLGDGSGVDGNSGFCIERVEGCCINGGIGDGDGIGIASSGEACECGEIALSDGGGDDAGCFIGEVIGLRSGGCAAVDGDVDSVEIADAVGGDSLDEVGGSASECVDGAGIWIVNDPASKMP